MAADDNPFSQLSPAEQAYLLGGGKQGAPATAASGAASTPVSTQPTTTTTSTPPAGGWGHDVATAFTGGISDVGANIVSNLGGTPNPLPADAQTAMQAHPVVTTAGNVLGGAVVGAPLAMGAELAAPALAGRMLGGAVIGGVQNLLTGDPNQPWYERAAVGAGLGAGGSWLGNRIGRMFGSDATLATQGVQDAGNTAKAAGIDVLPQNLPQGGSAAAQTATPKGVAATPGQIQQVNKAFGNIVGGDVSDFSAANLGPLTNKVGGEISTAVNQGQVQMTPQLESDLQAVLQNAHAPGIDPLVTAKIEAEVDKVLSVAPNVGDSVTGSQFDRLVGAGSKLSKYTGDANQDLSGLARQLDTTLDRGFQASSNPGVYDQYVGAKTRYRMLKAIEDNVEGDAAGNIKPGSIIADINRRFPDMPTQTGPGTVGQASDLARAVTTLFGGSQGAPGAAKAAGGWLSQHPLLAGALGAGGAGGIYQAATNPAAIGNLATWGASHIPVVGLGAAALTARNVLSRVGAAYQRSPAFANTLLQRGTQEAPNPLAAYTGAAAAGLAAGRRESRD